MKKMTVSAFFVGLLGSFLPAPATATVIYTYTGAEFDQVSNDAAFPGSFTDDVSRVSGSFTVDTALAPNLVNHGISPSSFTFTDSLFTFTQSNSDYRSLFRVSTDAQGDITAWSIELQDVDPLSTDLSPFSPTHRLVTRTLASFLQTSWHYACLPTPPGQGSTALCGPGFYHFDSQQFGATQIRQGIELGSWQRTEVPEPLTLSLLIVGLLGIVTTKRPCPAS